MAWSMVNSSARQLVLMVTPVEIILSLGAATEEEVDCRVEGAGWQAEQSEAERLQARTGCRLGCW